MVLSLLCVLRAKAYSRPSGTHDTHSTAMPLTLYITNKNYSSWSMRPWVLLTEHGIPFTETLVRLDALSPDSAFRARMQAVSPAGKVPVLVDDALAPAGRAAIWDSLAICEYLADTRPDLHLWPEDRAARARARTLCADMHSGFATMRNVCPMNIEASLPEVGRRLVAEDRALQADLARLDAMWAAELALSDGPFLFGARFTIADAFFVPMCMRIRTYGLPLSARSQQYLEHIFTLSSVQRWISDAVAEHDFLQFEEPYRKSREE